MTAVIRHDYSRAEVLALLDLPFADLMHRAGEIHRANFDPNQVQVSTLLSIKTGGCPEDCAYCPQAARYDTGLKAQKLMAVEDVLEKAAQANINLTIDAEEVDRLELSLTVFEALARRVAALVPFGQHLCQPVSPWCSRCKVSDYCDRIGVTRSGRTLHESTNGRVCDRTDGDGWRPVSRGSRRAFAPAVAG